MKGAAIAADVVCKEMDKREAARKRKRENKRDIVERLIGLALREINDVSRDPGGVVPKALMDAVREIERLRRELEVERAHREAGERLAGV